MRFSIKIKWTLFIVLLLIISIMLTGFFMLRGVSYNQRGYYEELLQENSKNANLYIRESYISSDSNNFEEYYVREAENLMLNLKRIINLPITLYDMEGQILCRGDNIFIDRKPPDIMINALKDQSIYEKNGDKIVYLAPIYDFNKQIGVLEIMYNTTRESILYRDIKLLFYRIGIMFISLASLVGIMYFSKIAGNILKLRYSVEAIEKENYDSIVKLESGDELESLSLGIFSMARTIKQNVEDITIEKEKLELAIKKLGKLEKQQKEFIGNITHEFKTPLTVLKAQIDLMSMYKDDEEMCCRSKLIAEKELKRLDNMVENILSLSKVEKYSFEFKKNKVNTKKLLEDICMRMEGKASKFGIEIMDNLQDAYIFIDTESFMQIFINIIDNAIKYNLRDGRIYVRNYIKEYNNYIEVEDTGIGIEKEHRDKIFEPFYTVDKNRSKDFSGTGLGLSLVKSLVESQGGKIRLMDTKKTTCFEIVFPICNEGIIKI
ncbi:HAMP domain-containing sensor histidine kinase [Tissierella praeacuta]|uniref:sensor histidine kinase n=1 Tax=Tissierella praeacuta TaxID=43131 RepID=UPI00333FAB63